MSDHDAFVDSLFAAAREQEPPPLSEEAAAQLVRRAQQQGRQRRRARRQRLVSLAVAAAVAGLALGAGLWWWRGAVPGVEAPGVFRAELPTGDRIVATTGAQVQVVTLTNSLRRVSLREGTALFDVAPLGEGEQFVVVAPDVEVHVAGTVFSIDATQDRTTVRVYEGRVLLFGREEMLLEPGPALALVEAKAMWDSAQRRTSVLRQGPLAEFAAVAVQRRDGPAATTVGPGEGIVVSLAPGEDESASPDAGPPTPDEASTAETGPRAHRRSGARRRGRRLSEPAASTTGSVSSDGGPSRPDSRLRVRAAEPALAEARRWVAQGQAEEVLPVAQKAIAAQREPGIGHWLALRADSLRSLSRFPEAAFAYDQAVRALDGAQKARAGYLAAAVRLRHLDHPSGVLASLDASGADRAGSRYEQRALLIRAQALRELGRRGEARAAARRWLSRFPRSEAPQWLRQLAD
jgi:hypothetical protein